MTRSRDLDSILDEWFAEGPSRIADRVIDDAIRTIDHTRQARGGFRLARYAQMNGTLRLAAVAIAALVAVAIGAGLIARYSPDQVGRPTLAPSATSQPTPSAAVSPSPSATAASSPAALPKGGDIVHSGTYVTKFNPRLTLTIDDAVTFIGCSAPVVATNCHGQVDVNLPGWVGIEFGPPLFDIQVFRVDKLKDPRNAGKLIDPPADLVSWISSRPGVSIVAAATSVTVGGLPATQIDVGADRAIAFGPIPGVTDIGFGLGKGQRVRLLVLKVDGHQVVISRTLSGYMASLQPIVDSIVWH